MGAMAQNPALMTAMTSLLGGAKFAKGGAAGSSRAAVYNTIRHGENTGSDLSRWTTPRKTWTDDSTRSDRPARVPAKRTTVKK
jgi:hypothetical protein